MKDNTWAPAPNPVKIDISGCNQSLFVHSLPNKLARPSVKAFASGSTLRSGVKDNNMLFEKFKNPIASKTKEEVIVPIVEKNPL